MPNENEVQVITLGSSQDGEENTSSSSASGREGQSAASDASADTGGNDTSGTQVADTDSGNSEHSGSTNGPSGQTGQTTIKQFQLVTADGTVYGTTNLTVSEDGTVSMLVSPQQVQMPETYYVDTLNYSFFTIVSLVVILAFVGIIAGAAVSRTLHASLEKFG